MWGGTANSSLGSLCIDVNSRLNYSRDIVIRSVRGPANASTTPITENNTIFYVVSMLPGQSGVLQTPARFPRRRRRWLAWSGGRWRRETMRMGRRRRELVKTGCWSCGWGCAGGPGGGPWGLSWRGWSAAPWGGWGGWPGATSATGDHWS